MDKKSQLEYLLSTSAFKSLNAEVELSKYIQSLGWKTVQGSYYRDVLTDKFRELDIFARKLWKLKSDESIAINICFLIEVKSLSDFNIIFSDLGNGNNLSLLDDFLGYDMPEIGKIHGRQSEIVSLLEGKGIDDVFIKLILDKVNDSIFPDGISVFAETLDLASPMDIVSCSFREFSGKNEKDLDNSVLWRANQALISAATAVNKRNFDNNLSDLDIKVDLALKHKYSIVEFVSREITHDAKRISLLHPVVVVDSPLWIAGNNNLELVNWCRFVQNDFYGHAKWWVDVVNYNSFNQYFNLTSQYYENELYKRMQETPLF